VIRPAAGGRAAQGRGVLALDNDAPPGEKDPQTSVIHTVKGERMDKPRKGRRIHVIDEKQILTNLPLNPKLRQIRPLPGPFDARPPAGKGHFDRFFVENAMMTRKITSVEAHIYKVAGGEIVVASSSWIHPGEIATFEIPWPNEDVVSRIVHIILTVEGGGTCSFQKEIPPNLGEYINCVTVGVAEHHWSDKTVRWTHGMVVGHLLHFFPMLPGEIGEV
jgi:hypothetical protein